MNQLPCLKGMAELALGPTQLIIWILESGRPTPDAILCSDWATNG